MPSPLITPVMTLPEYLKGHDIDDAARPLVEMFAKSSDIMEVIPFEGLTGPIYLGYRQAALTAGMGFRAINTGSTSGAGNVTPFQEATYLIDHDITVDRAIVDRGGTRRRAWEEQMGMARLGEIWVQNFLKGDNTTTNTVFNGLQKRAARYGRTIDNSIGTAGGTALSLYQLDWTIQNTRKPTHIIIPWAMRSRFIQAARNTAISGFVIQNWGGGGHDGGSAMGGDRGMSGPGAVGGVKMSYAGLPILFGYEKDLHPAILPFSEVAPAGGAPQTSSIYVVSLGEGGLRGIQINPMNVEDVGLLQDRITYSTHISWDVGLVDEGMFCFSRLCGIQNLAIVA